ncbi:CehA/McbA family metallohydrolase [Microbacterium sp. A196]|uniref:CehA/McbA family metallohydrolase n=1 Tax=Microbacterium sp. A196 TaxID=3457320 RepID=UPI003FD08CCC
MSKSDTPVTTAASPIDEQPYLSMTSRVIDALSTAGEPLPTTGDAPSTVVGWEEALRARVLVSATLDEQGFATLTAGTSAPVLVERGWRAFLIRVENPHGVTAPLHLETNPVAGYWSSPSPGTLGLRRTSASKPDLLDRVEYAGLVEDAWMQIEPDDAEPLSGLPLEYRVVHVYCSSGTARPALIGVSAVYEDRGFHGGNQRVRVECEVEPSFEVEFDLRDSDGRTCVASLTIQDEQQRVYPPPQMRIAPDMRFQDQVYRGHGETIRLPRGRFTVEARRGPEYVPVESSFLVDGPGAVCRIRLDRWIRSEDHGWYSGDPHLHAAGCSHYEIPSQGVAPETMIRQIRGEALSVGSVLTWGPAYYHQKQFFTGEAISPSATLEHRELQEANNQVFTTADTEADADSAARYDLEISGFPSSHLGHLILLNLAEQDYPDTTMLEDWPSTTTPITAWAREQGALVGYAHAGFGMAVSSLELPNHEMPPFNSVGMNGVLVDLVHDTVDFIAGAEGHPAMELSAWYHMLSSGYRLAFLGETDYPCISDERAGAGRTYVQMDGPIDGGTGWDRWVDGIRAGRVYSGDGRSHVLRFDVDDAPTGSTLELASPRRVTVTAQVAARLEEQLSDEWRRIRATPAYAWPSWHLERARIDETREVPLELVVNGYPVASRNILADGSLHEVTFEIDITASSWIALRILPSVHTSATVVKVAGRPVRASRRSAEWCRDAVEALWIEKSRFIRPAERADAEVEFRVARDAYQLIADQCPEGS